MALSIVNKPFINTLYSRYKLPGGEISFSFSLSPSGKGPESISTFTTANLFDIKNASLMSY